jgi:hypothetical protein
LNSAILLISYDYKKLRCYLKERKDTLEKQVGNESGDSETRQFLTNANQAATVSISTPADGDIYALGRTITFSGSADDLEDGSITGTALSWYSNIEVGLIGTGESFTKNNLVVGFHKITLPGVLRTIMLA